MVNLMEDDPCDLPFLFSNETTAEDFTSSRYEYFLKDQGVHGQGMWRTEGIDHKRPKYGALKYDDDDPWVLPSESVAFEFSCPEPETPLTTWQEYYQHRELSLNSPAAILMTYPMTLYYILTSLFGVVDRESVTIHILGAEKEADLIPSFSELQYLLPSLKLQILLVGPLLSRRACTKTHNHGSLTIRLIKGLYHQLFDKMEDKPDLVIGFNAGLSAYRTWMETIKLITTARLPAYFTDFCRDTCSYTRAQITSHPELCADMSTETLNPFRSPVRVCDLGSKQPRFSNNYIYQILTHDNG